MDSSPDITPPDPAFTASREEAERKSALLPVMERISGQQQRERGGPPEEAQIVEAVRSYRLERHGR